jgi:hypothetical protein
LFIKTKQMKKGLSLTTLGENTMLMQYDSLTIQPNGDRKFTGLKTYYNENEEPIKGTREEVVAEGLKISKRDKLEFLLK